jgi:uncharacterized membrane protein
MPSTEAILGQVQFFQLLDNEERKALADLLDENQLAAGEMVFTVGDPGDRMFVVSAGAIELTTKDKLGQSIVLMVARPGDMFGELSLLDEGPRTATATALEPSSVLVLDRSALRRFIHAKPDGALDMMAVMGRRMRETTSRLRQLATRNVNEAHERTQTALERFIDAIAAFSGSFAFLAIHAVLFTFWIGWNVIPGLPAFDPFPFGFLTMCVSLEAIFLSVIVLLSQNRQAEKDRIRSDVEYDVNLKAELEVSHLHEKVDGLHAALLSRLQRIESALTR